VKAERTDLYKVLQVDPSANPLVIQAAYRVLAQIHHPDVSGDADEMKRLNAAWEVLGNARKRSQYDIERAGRHAPQSPVSQHTAPRAAAAASSHAAQPGPQPATAAREDTAGPPVGSASGSVIRFGRYDGWTVGQVARVDPPFLEWLRRVPLGRALKPEIDLALQRADGVRRMGIGSTATSVTNDQPVHAWSPGAPTRVR
jgi:curved DNA-binding protein CbpA